jgi:hypothetical protein
MLSVYLFTGKGGFCIKVIGFPAKLIAKPAPTSHCLDWVFGFAIGFCARRYAVFMPEGLYAGARDAIAYHHINYRNAVGVGLGIT